MLHIQDLLNQSTQIDGKWVIARPIIVPLICRIKDAWQVIKGKADAVKFYKQ